MDQRPFTDVVRRLRLRIVDPVRGNGRYEHDAAAASLLYHLSGGRLRAQELPSRVDIERAAPFLRRQLKGVGTADDAGETA